LSADTDLADIGQDLPSNGKLMSLTETRPGAHGSILRRVRRWSTNRGRCPRS